jgi:NADPH-dependent glutamate synthase beta subunit-like oxidoreductase
MVSEKYQVEIVDASYYKGVISCQNACPVHTDAQGYVNAVSKGDCEDGYIMARQPNPFASTCGQVCNAPCEAACRRGNIDDPISIRALKRFLCERYGVESREHLAIVRASGEKRGAELMVKHTPGNSNTVEGLATLLRASGRRKPGWKKAKVAVIGSGPAGLTAAHDLAAQDYKVTVFEAAPFPGGMLLLGIPEYRLSRSLIRFEIEEILGQGVELKVNMRLGKDFTVTTLREEGYEAIFIAIGAYVDRDPGTEGTDLDGVIYSLDLSKPGPRGDSRE